MMNWSGLPEAYYQDDLVYIIHGDCREILPQLSGISAVVTDPPYGLEFMGKEWDKFQTAQWRGERESWQDRHSRSHIAQRISKMPRYFSGKSYFDFTFQWATECLRVLKPGGQLLSFGGTRTYHRLVCAIEDAGFEIRDCIMWVYGSGFPKSLSIGKSIDKKAGAERKVIGKNPNVPQRHNTGTERYGWNKEGENYNDNSITIPTTPEAKLWEGYGTGLKPAYEPIVVAMKPLDGTFANNALKYKVGGLNIDATRIPTNDIMKETKYPAGRAMCPGGGERKTPETKIIPHLQGRFPANLILDGSQEVMELFPETSKAGNVRPSDMTEGTSVFGIGQIKVNPAIPNDKGGSAARFFYCAKASRAERDAGLEDMPESVSGTNVKGYQGDGIHDTKPRIVMGKNNHPCIKPLSLMTYLCRLVKMPEYNLILDPFCGSGTTLLACKKLGVKAIGIESNEEYCRIAVKRLRNQ